MLKAIITISLNALVDAITARAIETLTPRVEEITARAVEQALERVDQRIDYLTERIVSQVLDQIEAQTGLPVRRDKRAPWLNRLLNKAKKTEVNKK